MASRTQSRTLTDHDEIRRWAEERGARPACVRRTGGGDDIGMIRLDFPGYSGEQSLEEIGWDDWFGKFDESKLALLVQEETARGQKSNFNKLIGRETAQARAQGERRASRRTLKSRRGGATGARGRTTRSARGQSRRAGSAQGKNSRRATASAGRSRSARSSRSTRTRRAGAQKKTTRRAPTQGRTRRRAA